MKIKKILAFSLAFALTISIVSISGISSLAAVHSFVLDSSLYGGNEVINNWQPMYIPSANKTVENVKTDFDIGAPTIYWAKIPGYGTTLGWESYDYSTSTIGDDCYAGMWLHAGQTYMVRTGEYSDMGVSFTAPATNNYKIYFWTVVPSFDGTPNNDGVRMMLYKNDFTTPIYDMVVDQNVAMIDTTLDLNQGDKLYFLFNKNGTILGDTLYIGAADISINVPEFSGISFPNIAPVNAEVTNGTIFSQYFNMDYPQIPASWKAFYINEYNSVLDMVRKDNEYRYVIPNKTDINQYAQIAESIGNTNHTAQDFYTGDYFIAPFDGIVKIDCNFSTQSGDGVGIAVYKNDFNTLISAREVFNSANASTGKNLIVNNVNVKRGDKLIFLYDKNGDVYGDVFVVNKKQIEYTYAPPYCFDYSVSGLNILTGLSEKTSVASFSQGIHKATGVTYEVSNVNNDFVGTGTTVAVTANNTTSTYTVVLYGDVDGDGEILLDDLILVRDNLLETDTLNPTAQLAGDIYGEGSITLNSLVGLMSVVSEDGTINQNR